ncbi:MAG: T9SS type A sorting domain-containing protein, partial [Bacteroidetes bacterium]|nr:T9SS type A sorting domain-containing protein [Bacteroidota bacterium]
RPLLEAVNIDEHSVINNEIIIYPNPVNDIVNIYIPNTTKNSIDIHIYDIQGREVKNVQMNPLQKEISIDCSEFNPGMYLLLFKDSDYLESKKLIIN